MASRLSPHPSPFAGKRAFVRLAAAFAIALAAHASAVEPEPVVRALVHARLWDGTGAPPVSDAVVVIRGDRIVAAGPAATVPVPADAQVLDVRGATVLPGLINTHVHGAYTAEHLQAWARAGVTTVRDECPDDPVFYVRSRDRLATDPRNATVIAATPIVTVPFGYGTSFATTPEAMRSLVQAHLDLGADLVKTSLEEHQGPRRFEVSSREILAAIVETAHARHKKVSIHVSEPDYLAVAVELGVDDIAHGVVRPVPDPLLSRMVEKKIAWIPTLELWTCVSQRWAMPYLAEAEANVARFQKAGGLIALGTDTNGYECTWDTGLPITELLAMRHAGLATSEVLLASTRNGAQVIDREAELGTIEPGKRADLLAVRGDPLTDLRALETPVLVVHRGEVIRDDRLAKTP